MEPLLEARQVQELLFQRYPILLVDRVLSIEKGKGIVGLKNFTVNEPYLQGHFPGNPIVPGSILIEAMAQVGAIFVAESEMNGEKRLMYLVGLDGVRFRKPVLPGDQVRFTLELLRKKRGVWKVKGIAQVGEQTVMEAVMLAAVESGAEKELP